MLIFLYGQDSYRLKQAKDDIIRRYKAKYPDSFNFFSFDALDTPSIDILEDVLKSMSFFGEHKLVVLKNIFLKKLQAETVRKYIDQYNLTTANDVTLLVAENCLGKDLVIKYPELFQILANSSSLVKNIEPLSGTSLTEWVKQEFRTQNCVIDPSAINKLISIAGNDTWRLSNEIEKLSAYKNSDKILSTDIDTLTTRGLDMNIFNLVDAVAKKDRSNAVKLLYQEMKIGQDPYYILTMLIHQFRNILITKDLQDHGYSENEISRKAKLHPFVVKKSISNPFNSEEAAKIYNRLLSIDTGFKMGRLDLEDSLYSLVI